MENNLVLGSKSRGTTLISCPYDKGIILATDTRASDDRYREYYTPTKIDKFTSKNRDFQIYVLGAGASIGSQVVAGPAIASFLKILDEYKVDLNEIKTPEIFLDIFNRILGSKFVNTLTPLQGEVLSCSAFIVTLKTNNFLISFPASFTGGDCFWSNYPNKNYNHPNLRYSNLGGQGSGYRYLMGSILSQNEKKPFYTRTKQEVVEWLKDNFQVCINKDLGSSTSTGLTIVVIDEKEETESYTILEKQKRETYL